MTIKQKDCTELARLQAEIEDIRTTSSNIHEVVDRLKKLWLSMGIKVTFSSYPNTFAHQVSNTHSAPKGYPQNWSRDPDKPRGYPGWSGNWIGTVEIVDKEKYKCNKVWFSDLITGKWSSSEQKPIPAVPWLHTGSGGGGDTFHFDGRLYIYDFPKMREEFEASGGIYEVMKKDYYDAVKSYRLLFKRHQNEYVNSHKESADCAKLLEQLSKLTETVVTIQKQVQDHYTAKFAESYDVKLPTYKTVFLDDKLIEAVSNEVNYDKATPLPELASTEKYIRELSQQVQDYREKHPEVFI